MSPLWVSLPLPAYFYLVSDLNKSVQFLTDLVVFGLLRSFLGGNLRNFSCTGTVVERIQIGGLGPLLCKKNKIRWVEHRKTMSSRSFDYPREITLHSEISGSRKRPRLGTTHSWYLYDRPYNSITNGGGFPMEYQRRKLLESREFRLSLNHKHWLTQEIL